MGLVHRCRRGQYLRGHRLRPRCALGPARYSGVHRVLPTLQTRGSAAWRTARYCHECCVQCPDERFQVVLVCLWWAVLCSPARFSCQSHDPSVRMDDSSTSSHPYCWTASGVLPASRLLRTVCRTAVVCLTQVLNTSLLLAAVFIVINVSLALHGARNLWFVFGRWVGGSVTPDQTNAAIFRLFVRPWLYGAVWYTCRVRLCRRCPSSANTAPHEKGPSKF